MSHGIEEHLTDPITSLNYTMSLMEKRFPLGAGKIWTDEGIADVRAQVMELQDTESRYERVVRYTRAVLASCVPEEEKIDVLAITTIAPGVSNSREMLQYIIRNYLNN